MRRGGREVETAPLAYAAKPSTFRQEITVQQPGEYEVTVYAYDPVTGNTGIDRTTFVVR